MTNYKFMKVVGWTMLGLGMGLMSAASDVRQEKHPLR